MAISNAERVGKALDLLNQGLFPFMKRELKAYYGDSWFGQASANLREYQMPGKGDGDEHWDTQALLLVMWDQWNTVFRNVLGQAERSLVSELREVRNKWAHQEPFSTDDAYRALDSVQRLLTSVSAADQATEVERQKQELLRIRFEDQARKEVRKAAVAPIEGQPAVGLRPWREVVTPHPDVASGRFQQAEFAADLAQVARGEGANEYRNPREFFQRTYLTEGLRHLLTNALLRLDANAGDPVVELLTNFGGGKTHSLLALYHLVSGVPVNDLPGIEPMLQTTGVSRPPLAQRAVLVGTELSPGQAHTKSDGTVVRTLWGDLAWQLLGKDGYALVADADRQGVSPGSDVLRQLFSAASPCLILIDEWVAYMRQLYGVSGLPAGSFDANLSFAQALTEAAKATPKTLLVASIPASDIEIGGEGGREAVVRLRNTFGRLESTWRPASAEEGFEIVRRRLFQPITQQRDFTARDAVARAFNDLYRTQPQAFPAHTRCPAPHGRRHPCPLGAPGREPAHPACKCADRRSPGAVRTDTLPGRFLDAHHRARCGWCQLAAAAPRSRASKPGALLGDPPRGAHHLFGLGSHTADGQSGYRGAAHQARLRPAWRERCHLRRRVAPPHRAGQSSLCAGQALLVLHAAQRHPPCAGPSRSTRP